MVWCPQYPLALIDLHGWLGVKNQLSIYLDHCRIVVWCSAMYRSVLHCGAMQCDQKWCDVRWCGGAVWRAVTTVLDSNETQTLIFTCDKYPFLLFALIAASLLIIPHSFAHDSCTWGRIHVGRISYPPPILASRIRPLGIRREQLGLCDG